MWIIAGYVRVDVDKRDAFVDAHRDLIQRARHAPGCLDVAITGDPVEPGRIYNYERWESWDAIEAWRARVHAPETGIVMHEVEVTAFEIASSRLPF